jgi:hypothetical protein
MAEELPITQAPLNKARKDKFRLILTLPNIMRGIDTRSPREDEYLNLDSLQFSVYGVNIPAPNVPHVPLHYSGQNYNVTSFDRPEYPPVNVNFTVDNEFKNYWVIWKWLQLLNDPINSTYGRPDIFKAVGGEYPELEPQTLYDYTTHINIISLDEYNKEKANFEFRHAFVTRLSDYTYNYRDPEEIDCSFEFVFNQLDIKLL